MEIGRHVSDYEGRPDLRLPVFFLDPCGPSLYVREPRVVTTALLLNHSAARLRLHVEKKAQFTRGSKDFHYNN